MKVTPLFNIHKKYNAKFVNFNGWEMPVWFEDLRKEHLQVRQGAGVFDVSHMGEIEISGKDAETYVDYIFTNKVSDLSLGQARYGFICNTHGGVVDDIIVYKLDFDRFFLCVNAGNIENVFSWLTSNIHNNNVSVVNLSSFYGQLAIQGPKAVEYIDTLFPDSNVKSIKKYNISNILELENLYSSNLEWKCPNNNNFLIARTGYTGEDGFELFVPNEKIIDIYEQILKEFESKIKPCGLGSRDTLRIEMGFPLHGNELRSNLTPIEANLARFINFEKKDFIGKNALEKVLSSNNSCLVGFKMHEKSVPRSGYKVFSSDSEIGFVTSGTFSPVLEQGVGLALIDSKHKDLDQISIQIRGSYKCANIVNYPFI